MSVVLAGLISGGLFLLPRALMVLAAAPLLLLARASGGWKGLEATGVGALLVGVAALSGHGWLGEVGQAIAAFVLLAGLPASLLVWGLSRDRAGIPALARAWGVWLAVVAGLIVAMGGGSLRERGQAEVERGLDAWVALSAERATDSAEARDQLARIAEHRGALVEGTAGMLPGLIAVAGLLLMWMNLVYVRWFVGGSERREGDDLCTFSVPFPVIWGASVCMALVLLWMVLPPAGWVDVLGWSGANGLLFLGALYWLQGVAVVNWWFLRLPLSPLPRALGLGMQVMAMAIPVFSVGYLVAGLGDVWLELRGTVRGDGAESRNGAER